MKKAISFFGISLIFLLLLSTGTTVKGDVEGDTDGDTITVQTDGLVVEIKGGVEVKSYNFHYKQAPMKPVLGHEILQFPYTQSEIRGLEFNSGSTNLSSCKINICYELILFYIFFLYKEPDNGIFKYRSGARM